MSSLSQPAAPARRGWLARLFLSPDEPRLRALWRLLLQTILLLSIGIALGIPFGIVAFLLLGSTAGTGFFAANTLLELIVVTASVWLARRVLDRRTFTSLGLQLEGRAGRDLAAGILITLIMMGSIFAVLWSLGWLQFRAFSWNVDPMLVVLLQVSAFFVVFVLVGWNEELLFRGYHLQTVASGLNLFWGVLISSVIFGLLHLGNPNATWVSAAGIFCAGLFLAYGYVRTRQLWLSIGLHIGWNFFEGVVFGFPVSGLTIYPLIRISVSGPVVWTGGAFGPEAGLIVLPALAIGAGLIYVYTYRRERI